MKKIKISILISVFFLFSLFSSTAFAVPDDSILSKHIKEADGTSGQNTNSGSGIKTGHIQDGAVTTTKIIDGAVTDAKITGPISRSKLEKYAKVAVVAQDGGDYTDPVVAMNTLASWCGTPSSTNPCLLKIMPGVYDVGVNSLQMASYVDIEGSGENVTKITGNVTSWNSGVVRGSSDAEIRFLTVENKGGGTVSHAIYNSNTKGSLKVTN